MILAPQRRWVLPVVTLEDPPDGIPRLVARIMCARGIAVADMPAFLEARPSEAGPPMLDQGLAAERIRRALAARERIVVYGDYDVDGVAGSALLVRAFRGLGASVGAYIPDRYEEGYGLNAAALGEIASGGTKLVISVDCGITALAEAELARELGMDLIVTDHHHPPPRIPRAFAVLNPRRPDDPSLDRELCGAGVAYALARDLLGDRVERHRAELLQLVAIATVADVVPLRAGNRHLVRSGLDALNAAPVLGVRALAERAGLRMGKVTAGDLGWVIGPRLNAAGRIADASDALRLLLTEDAAEAAALAERLEERNGERQQLTRDVVREAREHAKEQAGAWVTVVAERRWAAGIVGLAASRLVEDHGRPAVVIAIDGDEGKGSCRSIAGVHIAEALAECSDLLTRHGGHAMAAGFSLPAANIEALRERLDGVVRARLQGVRPVPTLVVDGEIEPDALTPRLALELAMLEPCGAANPQPRLLLRDVRVHGIRQVGADADHLRCKLVVGRFTFDAMAFRRGDHADAVTLEGRVDAVVSLRVSPRDRVELEIQDMGPVGTADGMSRVPVESASGGSAGGGVPRLSLA